MFLSDNGASAEILQNNDPNLMPGSNDTYMSYRISWANASNTPFKRYKIWIYEGGTATPCIAWWPGVIQPNSISHEVRHIMDIMPTCLDVAGVEYPQQIGDKPLIPLDGKSLLPIFQGRPAKGHQTLYWEHEKNRGIRQGQWKLVYDDTVKKWELYNMERDRTATKNLAADYPDLVRDMSEK